MPIGDPPLLPGLIVASVWIWIMESLSTAGSVSLQVDGHDLAPPGTDPGAAGSEIPSLWGNASSTWTRWAALTTWVFAIT